MKKSDKAKALKTPEKVPGKAAGKLPGKSKTQVMDPPKKAAAAKGGKPAKVPAAKAQVPTVPKTAEKPKLKEKLTQAMGKPVVKSAATQVPAVKPSAKPVVPSSVSKPLSKSAAQAAPKSAAKPTHSLTNQKSVTASLAPEKTAVPVQPAVSSASDSNQVPTRMARPSARLAQITVPSMAQSVASTAAKASYSQVPQSVVAPVMYAAAKKDPKLANNWKTKSAEQLTDEEVLSMPDTEYMNDKQMAFFRLKLVALKLGILNSADQTTEHLREDTVIVPDPADRATIEEEHALELRTRDRERKLLKKIEQSIARIDANDYGYCDETGEPIGVGRLMARPTATLSLEAQQRRELKQKMFGD